jgi:NAD(P)H-hydrate epimerase
MGGAAVLAGRAALRAGAGLVRIACPVSIQDSVASAFPSYTTLGIRQHTDGSFGEGAAEEIIELGRASAAVVIGPGLGRSQTVVTLVRHVLGEIRDVPVVLDADGLVAVSPFTEEYGNRTAALVMTPHPGEFSRLTAEPILRTDAERKEKAIAFAQRFGHVLLLKGSGTLVADRTRLYRNSTGNPGMATGGSGDILSGVAVALIGQGLSGFDATVLAAWVHGRAGDMAAGKLGQTALTSADLLDYLPAAFRELEAQW